MNRDACRRIGARSVICVPLIRSVTVLGVLEVSSRRTFAFGARDVATLRRIAEFVTFVIGAAAGLSGAVDAAFRPDPNLDGGDDEGVSRFVARVLVPAQEAQIRNRIGQVIAGGEFYPVFQPVLDLAIGNGSRR